MSPRNLAFGVLLLLGSSSCGGSSQRSDGVAGRSDGSGGVSAGANGRSTAPIGGAGPGTGGATAATGGRGGSGAGDDASGGTGQAGGSGGEAGSGATGASGAAAGSGGTPPVAACEFSVKASLSEKIQTVGVVEWSTTLSNVSNARIEFGLTTSYGMTAPASARSSGYRTQLLGMKQNRTYHYRLSASSPHGTCDSSDYTIETGLLPGGLPELVVTTNNAAALDGGFLATGLAQPSTSKAPALILDADGDIVWAYFLPGSDVVSARQSYDGASIWLNSVNAPSQGANVRRVSMDGLTEENYSAPFAGQNHQLAVLPDETVAFNAYGNGVCDDIKEFDPASGEVVTVISASAVVNDKGPCHLEAFAYSPADDTLIFSDRAWKSDWCGWLTLGQTAVARSHARNLAVAADRWGTWTGPRTARRALD